MDKSVFQKLKNVQNELSSELNELKESVKLKDSEIERLNQEISNLQTLVQIESLKTELANLKMLASERKTKIILLFTMRTGNSMIFLTSRTTFSTTKMAFT